MEYNNYFVAFVDVLGFKNIIDSYSRDKVYELFSRNFKRSIANIIKNGESLINGDEIHYKTMSDSIVFYVKEDAKNALFGLLANCATFQASLLAMDTPILTRGGVSYGGFFIDGDIMFGPALTSAYLLESQNAKYPRIIMNHSLLLQYGNEYCNNIVYEDDDLFWSINSLNIVLGKNKTGFKDFDHLSSYVVEVLDSTRDSSIREKYLYLRKKTNEINLLLRSTTVSPKKDVTAGTKKEKTNA